MQKLWTTSAVCLSLIFSQTYADNPNSGEIASFDMESVIASKNDKLAAVAPGSGSTASTQTATTNGKKNAAFAVLMVGLIAGGIIAMTSGSSGSKNHSRTGSSHS